jgi:hypothetical protein
MEKIISNKQYYCDICLTQFGENDTDAEPFTLSCGHTFCLACLHRFLKSHILEGNITPKCFKIVKNRIKRNNLTNSSQDAQPEDYIQIHDESINTANHILTNNLSNHNENEDFKLNDSENHEVPITFDECGIIISDSDINNIISTDLTLMTKLNRFKFFQDNKNSCECPNTSCGELLLLSSSKDPNMTCSKLVRPNCCIDIMRLV